MPDMVLMPNVLGPSCSRRLIALPGRAGCSAPRARRMCGTQSSAWFRGFRRSFQS